MEKFYLNCPLYSFESDALTVQIVFESLVTSNLLSVNENCRVIMYFMVLFLLSNRLNTGNVARVRIMLTFVVAIIICYRDFSFFQ